MEKWFFYTMHVDKCIVYLHDPWLFVLGNLYNTLDTSPLLFFSYLQCTRSFFIFYVKYYLCVFENICMYDLKTFQNAQCNDLNFKLFPLQWQFLFTFKASLKTNISGVSLCNFEEDTGRLPPFPRKLDIFSCLLCIN